MKKNQETAHTILHLILNGTRPLTEDGIRALVQEDPEIAVLLILEQARRLRDILGSKQRKAASTPSGMIPPHEKPQFPEGQKEEAAGLESRGRGRERFENLDRHRHTPPIPCTQRCRRLKGYQIMVSYCNITPVENAYDKIYSIKPTI